MLLLPLVGAGVDIGRPLFIHDTPQVPSKQGPSRACKLQGAFVAPNGLEPGTVALPVPCLCARAAGRQQLGSTSCNDTKATISQQQQSATLAMTAPPHPPPVLQVCGAEMLANSEQPKSYCLTKKVCLTCRQADAVRLPGTASLQRFCHQCGKFEDIDLFDGERRCAGRAPESSCCMQAWHRLSAAQRHAYLPAVLF